MIAFLGFWACVFALIALTGCGAKILRRQRAQRIVTRRSRYHEAYLAALQEWIEVPEIVEVAMKRGVMSRPGLHALREEMGKANEPLVRAFTAKLLSDRLVRRTVAKHLQAVHKMDKARAMKMLGGIAEAVR